ncbi:MAG TPA: hypothetical protein VKU44_04940 [Terriglobia bacterium]|nr:hypothetical protein [Terriglobia bacterium]
MSLTRLPWALWWAQIGAVLRIELRKTLLARRGWWIYLAAFAPVLMFGLHSLVKLKSGEPCDLGRDTHIFAAVFQFFFVRLVIFFGCVGIFMNLFRGEVLEKSLHYYFLAPIRREVLLAGKYVSGVLAAGLIFGSSTVLQTAALYWHFDSSQLREFLYQGHGLEYLASYVGVAILASIGYGSIFLAAGVMLRNPLVPAFVVFVWEAINGFLPPLLQKISVIYYLKSLCPVEAPSAVVDQGNPLSLIAFNAEPAAAAVAIFALMALSAVVLVIAGLQVRRMEINYGTE